MKIKNLTVRIFIAGLLVLMPLFGCQAQSAVASHIETIAVPDKAGITVKGVVVDDKNSPVPGVVVNDGFFFTVTDAQGCYYLASDLTRSKFVYLTVPSAFRVDVTKGIATGYYKFLDSKEAVNRRDFVLHRRSAPLNGFDYIAISDPQVRNYTQLTRFQKETLPDLKNTIASLKGREVYGMTLGDNVWDAMDLFPAYKDALGTLGIPFFSTIGNHDFNLAYTSLFNSSDASKSYAEENYQTTFGPVYYSVNIGKVHVVTLNDIDYTGDKKYKERLTQDQLDWLKNDLGYVQPGTVVFLNMHAPVLNQTSGGSGNIKNAAELLALLKDYKVHIFTGHTHFFENEEVAPSIYDHNIGAACGAWWAGEVNRCGAPNGYLIVSVNGDDVKWHYKSTGHDLSYQFRLYKPGEFNSQAAYFVANVWDWDKNWKVRWYADGKFKGEMEQFSDEDQAFIDMSGGKPKGYQTVHLFRVKPEKGTKTVTVETINRFGETYKQTVKL